MGAEEEVVTVFPVSIRSLFVCLIGVTSCIWSENQNYQPDLGWVWSGTGPKSSWKSGPNSVSVKVPFMWHWVDYLMLFLWHSLFVTEKKKIPMPKQMPDKPHGVKSKLKTQPRPAAIEREEREIAALWWNVLTKATIQPKLTSIRDKTKNWQRLWKTKGLNCHSQWHKEKS